MTLSDLISDLDSPHVTDPALKDEARHRLAQALRYLDDQLRGVSYNVANDMEMDCAGLEEIRAEAARILRGEEGNK